LIKFMKCYAHPAPMQTTGLKEVFCKFLRGQLTLASKGLLI